MLISASSEMKDEAWEFVRFMTSEESQKTTALTASTLPTCKALYDDREILEEVPMVAGAREALQNARPRPVSPRYSEMSRAMAQQFNNVLRGAITPGSHRDAPERTTADHRAGPVSLRKLKVFRRSSP